MLAGHMAKIYRDPDFSIDPLRGKQITICGYGSQGRAQALNLKDSGVCPTIFLRANSRHIEEALQDGLEISHNPSHFSKADVVVMLTPDATHPSLWTEIISPHLPAHAALIFAHGFSIHYKKIEPPPSHGIILVAPLGQGLALREAYTAGKGIPSLIAIHGESSQAKLELAMAYAKAIGSLRAFALMTTFREETEIDLFAEQVILCGGLRELIRKGFDTLVAAGYQPEIAYYSCVKEVAIAKLFGDFGVAGFMKKISDTARFGAMTRGERIITQQTAQRMKEILIEIQSGQFASEISQETLAKIDQILEKESVELIEKMHQQMENL